MWCGSAGNNKVVRWCGGGVVLLWGCCGVVDSLVFGFGVVDRVRGWGNERTPSRALPSAKRSFFNGILTSVPIPVIHITAYLILVF